MKIPRLDTVQNVYLIGIAGIGMSAVARYFLSQGLNVAGYDRERSALAQVLEEEGAVIHYTDNPDLIPDNVDLAIYTPAIPDSHAELTYLRDSDVVLLKRSEVLGLISDQYSTVAVAGTHGKTTTSSIIAYMMRKCGVDCTAFLGGIAVDLESNFVAGNSEWVIVEADEYDRSFWHLNPDVVVITSLDPDHLDVYGSFEQMVDDYVTFIRNVKDGGVVIWHEEVQAKLADTLESGLASDLIERGVLILTYGEGEVFFKIANVDNVGGQMQFDLYDSRYNDMLTGIRLNMIGDHNVENATASLVVMNVLRQRFGSKYQMQDAADTLSDFAGIKRRFEIICNSENLVVIDDYAHHPAELEAAISAAREAFTDRSITGIFQPHLYSRTSALYEEFALALDSLDEVFIVEIYPARELPVEGVTSSLIAEAMTNREVKVTTKNELEKDLLNSKRDVLLFMGAGDLDRRIGDIVNRMSSE